MTARRADRLDLTGARIAACCTAAGLPAGLLASGAGSVLEMQADGPDSVARIGAGHYACRYTERGQIAANNADWLFLDGPAVGATHKRRQVGKAAYIAIPLRLSALWAHLPGWLRYGPRGWLRLAGMLNLPELPAGHRRWLVFANHHPQLGRGPRYYVNPLLDIRALLADLAAGEADHALLRPLPVRLADAATPLAILAEDAAVPRLTKALGQQIGTRPVDIYTISGHDNHGIQGIACFPPALASAMLSRPGVAADGVRRLAAQDAALAQAAHLLLHASPRAVAPDAPLHADIWPTHPDALDDLYALLAEAGLAAPASMQALQDMLARHGMLPPDDALSIFALKNPYLAAHLAGQRQHPPGLVVFILRDLIETQGLVDDARTRLQKQGFIELHHAAIPPAQRDALAQHIRGGNWGEPEGRVQTGGPAHLVIALDPSPKAVTDKKMQRLYPRLDNARILAKKELRKWLASCLPASDGQKINAIHASDNSDEALDYIRILCPEMLDEATQALTQNGAARQ